MKNCVSEAKQWDAAGSGLTIMAMADENSEEEGRKRPKVTRPHDGLYGPTGQKRRGEMGEGLLLIKMAMLGYSVSRPWGDSDKYDLIVDTGANLHRVQLKTAFTSTKATSHSGAGGYRFRTCTRAEQSYRASQIDFLVTYIVPEDAWYVFPPSEFERMVNVVLYPSSRRKTKFDQYRDAWAQFEKQK